MMSNHVAWNERGMNDPLRSRDIAKVIKEYRIRFIGMLETKIKETNFSNY